MGSFQSRIAAARRRRGAQEPEAAVLRNEPLGNLAASARGPRARARDADAPPQQQDAGGAGAPLAARAGPPQIGLADLPDNAVRVLANHLPDRDRASLVATGFAQAHDPTIERLAVMERASHVETMVGFETLLGRSNAAVEYGARTINQLPLADRSAPLQILGYRIRARPASDWPLLIGLFRSAVEALPAEHRSDELKKQYLASEESVHALAALSLLAAAEAVTYGAAVDVVARQHGIVIPREIATLEAQAVQWQPKREVQAGRPADVVAREYGITLLETRVTLESFAITAAVKRAVTQGASADTLARRHGIVTSAGRAQLESSAVDGGAAARAVQSGEPVGQVMRQRGLIMQSSRAVLETLAIDGPADAKLRRGRSVLEVAGEHDIVMADAMGRMEAICAEHRAASSVAPG